MSRDPRLARRASYRFWTRDTIRFSDTDMAGHVNNVAMCAYLETGRLLFVREIRLRDRPPPQRGIAAGLNVSFLRESHWPGEVEIGCGVVRIGNASLNIGGGVFIGDACIAAAEMTIVNLSGSAPAPFDAETRAKLERWLLPVV
ncbi:MAG: thioesterase family protein [Rhodospirillales bacterium]|nr:MAG: thioesterase family protein [Rhodospirillales bacterium]